MGLGDTILNSVFGTNIHTIKVSAEQLAAIINDAFIRNATSREELDKIERTVQGSKLIFRRMDSEDGRFHLYVSYFERGLTQHRYVFVKNYETEEVFEWGGLNLGPLKRAVKPYLLQARMNPPATMPPFMSSDFTEHSNTNSGSYSPNATYGTSSDHEMNLDSIYIEASELLGIANTIVEVEKAQKLFQSISDYRDVPNRLEQCQKKIDAIREKEYQSAILYKQKDTEQNLQLAKDILSKLNNWRDSQKLVLEIDNRLNKKQLQREIIAIAIIAVLVCYGYLFYYNFNFNNNKEIAGEELETQQNHDDTIGSGYDSDNDGNFSNKQSSSFNTSASMDSSKKSIMNDYEDDDYEYNDFEYDDYKDDSDEEYEEYEEENDEEEYIFPYSDTSYLSKSDLKGMTKSQINLAKNELYARHGRMFQREDLQEYFDGCSWYTSEYTPEEWEEYGDSYFFNEYEMANRNLLNKAEKKKS